VCRVGYVVRLHRFVVTMCCAEPEDSEFRSPELDVDEFNHRATRTLFVGNLIQPVAKDVLRDTFSKFGPIIVSYSCFLRQRTRS